MEDANEECDLLQERTEENSCSFSVNISFLPICLAFDSPFLLVKIVRWFALCSLAWTLCKIVSDLFMELKFAQKSIFYFLSSHISAFVLVSLLLCTFWLEQLDSRFCRKWNFQFVLLMFVFRSFSHSSRSSWSWCVVDTSHQHIPCYSVDW